NLIESALTVNPSCKDEIEDQRPFCSSLSDQVCSDIWSAKNRGFLDVFDGKIRVGASPKSGTNHIVLENQRALIDSLPRLPADFAKVAGPILQKWKVALDEEEDSKAWDNKITKLDLDLSYAMDSLADARFDAKYPELANKMTSKRSPEENLKYTQIQDEISRELVDAKYKNHPNWQRVEHIFTEAKQDMIEATSRLPIPEEQKEKMLAKLRTIQLTLPYDNMTNDKSCASTQRNAMYMPAYHAFTFCAGFFNAFETESLLYGTITHEIGHAIDPEALRKEANTASPISTALAPLERAQGPAMPCSEWEKTKEKIFAADPLEGIEAKIRPLENLYGCLKSTKSLDPFNPETVRKAIKQINRDAIDYDASRNDFLKLSEPTYTKFGNTIINKYYMRPDLILLKDAGKPKIKMPYRDIDFEEIFVQDLACQKTSTNGKEIEFTSTAGEERERLFTRALENTEKINQKYLEESNSNCGLNCGSLVKYNLGKNIGEEFADWISFRALTLRLSRLPTAEIRNEAAALFASDLCTAPSISASVPGLANIEKTRSTEAHGEARIRRISVFTKENAAILGCRLEPDSKGFGQCEP
ncbi:MAG: hypothetical protein ACXWQO_05935, partial [Bdellovibrionota bacterium]